MKKIITLLLLIPLLSCQAQKDSPMSRRFIDDIIYEAKIDDKNFEPCRSEEHIIQYFNNSKGLEYEGEKPAIEKAFQEQYNASNVKPESGLIRIRFIVNCKGEAGWFRVIGMDNNYHEKNFDPAIVNQLLAICKTLDGWKQKIMWDKPYDYYQYLIFKIEKGQIVKILP